MRRGIVSILLGLYLGSCPVALAQTIRVCYVPDERAKFQDRGYTFDGRQMLNSAAPKLLNKIYFGQRGTVKQEFALIALNEKPISKWLIAERQCSAVFLGLFYSPDIPNVIDLNEIKEIHNWSLEKLQNLVIVSERHAQMWGYEHSPDSTRLNLATSFGLNTPLFSGPFGNITSFYQGGHSFGHLSAGQGNVLATNKNHQPTITLDHLSNDIILADVDLLTKLGGISDGKMVENDADILFANFWAYASNLAGTSKIIDSKSKSIPAATVTFSKSSFELMPSSIAQLDSIVSKLAKNSHLKVELRGYTDITGDPDANRRLSRLRAKIVRRYLRSNGVSMRRIQIKSYGSDQALYLGKDESLKVENRRVELHFH
jgi:outer membrane protein OmpA-like peptidoglycan-associated protein